MGFDYENHKKAIAANVKMLDAKMAGVYEGKEGIKTMLTLFAKTLLEFDFTKPLERKSDADSEQPLGNPDVEGLGISMDDLPNRETYHQQYPNSLLKPEAQILDFACGTGIVTSKLVPYMQGGSIVGIDINPAFLDKFQARASHLREQGVPIEGFEYDIMDKDLAHEMDSKFKNRFDLIYCTLSYHHIDNYEDVTERLCDFLAPGGELVILDFYNEDVENPLSLEATDAVRHMGGLKKESLHHVLQNKCGLTNVLVAREFRLKMWEEKKFISHHSTERIIRAMNENQLPTKEDPELGTLYLIESSIVMAIGQRKK